MLAAFFSVINSVLVKENNSAIISFYELMGGFWVITILFCLNGDIKINELSIDTFQFFWLLVLGVVCTSFAFLLGVYVMKFIAPYTVNLSVNLEPIYDKNFLSFCLKEVELFLQKNGYKKKIPEISSYHYKNKEIFQIIFFLFKKIDKNYRIITLPEDNILSTLKILGYPIFLTKSTLVSPINPRSHQILFHCLNWVIELCLYDTRVIFENQSIYSTDLKKPLIWNRMVKSYNRFLSKKRSTDNFKKILKITLANLLKPEKKKKNEMVKLYRKFDTCLAFLQIILQGFLVIKKRHAFWTCKTGGAEGRLARAERAGGTQLQS